MNFTFFQRAIDDVSIFIISEDLMVIKLAKKGLCLTSSDRDDS